MSIKLDEVLHVAKLAEIAVGDAELPKLVDQLNRIVNYVAQLDELPSEGKTEPFIAGPTAVRLRPDVPSRAVLVFPPSAMAPEFIDGFFVVPKQDALGEG